MRLIQNLTKRAWLPLALLLPPAWEKPETDKNLAKTVVCPKPSVYLSGGAKSNGRLLTRNPGLGRPTSEPAVSQFIGFAKLVSYAENTENGWDRIDSFRTASQALNRRLTWGSGQVSVLQLAVCKIIHQFFDRMFSEAEVPGEEALMRLLKALLSLFLLSPLLFPQTPALHGIDVTDLDREVDPCNDFYEFANGSWRANHPIPPTMVRWSKRSM